MLSWWAYLLSPEAVPLGDASLTVLRYLTPHVAASLLAAFLLLFALLHAALAAWLPLPARFSPADRAQARAWVAALFHHVPVALLAAGALGAAFFAPSGPQAPLWALAGSVPFSLAYVLSDFVATCLPELARGGCEMTLHHALGLAVSAAALLAPVELLRWAPHMWVCEASNWGLGVSWFARKAGRRGGPLQVGGQAAFVAAFVLTRVASLPVAVYGLTVAQFGRVAAAVGGGTAAACAAALWMIVALQLFWLARIARMLARAAGGAGGGGKEV